MKLKKTISAISLAALFATMGASAVEKNINVTASVDASVNLLQSDGNELPGSVVLGYSPATNSFETYRLSTAVHTNDTTSSLVVKLAQTPMLSNILDSTKTIPMSVTWGGKQLSTSDTTIDSNDMNYGTGGVQNVSSAKELSISASPVTGTTVSAGNYQGIVSIILTQSTQP